MVLAPAHQVTIIQPDTRPIAWAIHMRVLSHSNSMYQCFA